jgi:hypothetical protein
MGDSRLFITFAATLLVITGQWAQCQSAPKQKEQRVFSAEDENVNHPVAIPAEVMALLAKNEDVRNVLEYEKVEPSNLPASWFSAAEVRLGNKSERDLIIASKGPLRGANIDPFWVFIHDSKGFKLALSISLHDLVVKRTRSHGYRDLELSGMTASIVTVGKFRFDGNAYRESSEKTTDIK